MRPRKDRLTWTFVLDRRRQVPLPNSQFRLGERLFMAVCEGTATLSKHPKVLEGGRYLSCRVRRISCSLVPLRRRQSGGVHPE